MQFYFVKCPSDQILYSTYLFYCIYSVLNTAKNINHGNDSGNRSIPVQEGENNDIGEQIPTHVSQERHRNKEKDSLANRKQESQSRVTKKKRK